MTFKTWLRSPVLLGLTTVLSLTGCSGPWRFGTAPRSPAPTAPAACDQERYRAAVLDAVEPTSEDITSDLVAISPSNTQLVWNEDKSRVRMVIWTDFGGYKTEGDFLMTREVWMTTAPQVQAFCKKVSADNLVPRINQYLGLPPATERDNSRFFVEMWVNPQDLFRPCADAEVNDSTCALRFPDSATPEHKAWISNNYSSSYGFWQANQYPWTGLGYTYDWCNEATHVGASEFVIRKNSTVNITGHYDRTAYCAP